ARRRPTSSPRSNRSSARARCGPWPFSRASRTISSRAPTSKSSSRSRAPPKRNASSRTGRSCWSAWRAFPSRSPWGSTGPALAAGGWRPKRKRSGGFAGWLLDGNPLGRRLVFRAARKQVLKQTKGNYPAPLAALEAVEYGLAHGLARGLKREAQLFGQLAVTDVSRKLVQIFFATSPLKKDFGVPNPPAPAEVRRLGVVGSGFMGSGIAGTAVVQAGVDVRMKDADLPRVAKGLAAAREILDERLQRRRLTKYEHARLVALLSGADTYAGFGRPDLVIEAVSEDRAVKRQV